ncbi:hypothetical protein J007_01689 [Cryptococcus neoformans]|nr:hypothetical protein J007_01689 [Cryptococcus neoformans var. grubii]OXC62961.1 hypothetical protein C358_01695 [Cryptococcus neoformans var. grubii MW-RSA852]
MPSSPFPFYLLNAFAPTLHSGNQAAVIFFDSASHPQSTDEQFMTLVARDFNFAETAYLVSLDGSRESKIGKYGLRWFTPEEEVALCGHATLAASQAVFSINPAFETIEFTTRFSGVLTAKKVEDKQVEITLPSLPKNVLEAFDGKSSKEDLTKVGSVFGVKEEEIVAVSPFVFGTRSSVIVSLSPQVDLSKIKASEADLLAFSDGMIIVTQVAREQPDDQLHINSRVFAPGLGITEDPVTGSAHAYLTGYYVNSPLTTKLLPKKFAGSPLTTVLNGTQLSKRGGRLICIWDDGKVKLVGKAWEFGRGTLSTPQA